MPIPTPQQLEIQQAANFSLAYAMAQQEVADAMAKQYSSNDPTVRIAVAKVGSEPGVISKIMDAANNSGWNCRRVNDQREGDYLEFTPKS